MTLNKKKIMKIFIVGLIIIPIIIISIIFYIQYLEIEHHEEKVRNIISQNQIIINNINNSILVKRSSIIKRNGTWFYDLLNNPSYSIEFKNISDKKIIGIKGTISFTDNFGEKYFGKNETGIVGTSISDKINIISQKNILPNQTIFIKNNFILKKGEDKISLTDELRNYEGIKFKEIKIYDLIFQDGERLQILPIPKYK